MTKGERDNSATRGRGATPRKSTKSKRTALRISFDFSALAALKKVKWKPIVSVTMLIALVAPVTIYWDEIAEGLDQDIVSIEVRGNLKYLKAGILKAQLDRHLGEGFFALDLNAVKEEVEAMPWVYTASLRRQWPGTLMVYIKEQYPVAEWNGSAYLNPFGEIFRPETVSDTEALPMLIGPKEKAKEVLRRYVSYKDRLAAEEIVLSKLKLEPRGAWRVTLRNDVVLKLGRDPVGDKLNRFLKVYKQGLVSKYEEIESVDARYTNGIAVRWKEKQGEETKKSGSI